MKVSLRGSKFAAIIGVTQACFILFMGLFGDYKDINAPSNAKYVSNFEDVNTLVIIGIGLLLTYLKNYAFTSVAMTLMVGVTCVQWSAIVIGFIQADILSGEKFHYDIISIVEGLFASATVLISFCGILGQVNPVQLIVMSIFEIFFAQFNKYIGVDILKAADLGESIFIHMFGAYFGLAVAKVLYKPDIEKTDKEGSSYTSDLFCMLGTLILWVYWPSFNGGMAGDQTDVAVVNTFLSLCAATMMTFALSRFLDSKGRFEMMYLQNATLAGGVCMGTCGNMPIKPFGALVVGSLAGLICTLGFWHLTPFLNSKLRLHDTCGIHNLHALPAWLSVFASAVYVSTASILEWEQGLTDIFPEVRLVNGTLAGRTPAVQAGHQVAAACITTLFAVATGLLTGLILRLPIWNEPADEISFFDDKAIWKIPEGFPGEPKTADSNEKSNDKSTEMKPMKSKH